MITQPFSLSEAVATWIVENLEKGAEELGNEISSVPLKPTLCFALSYHVFHEEHHVVERYDGDHFLLGWVPAEMDPGGFCQIEIGGIKVFIHHETLNRLEGKELILETVEVGYPIPASKKNRLLRARPKSDGGNPPR